SLTPRIASTRVAVRGFCARGRAHRFVATLPHSKTLARLRAARYGPSSPCAPRPDSRMPRNFNQTVVIGMDGGGTHSLAVAVDFNGKARALARAGSLNFYGSGLSTARRTLKTLLRLLRNQLPPGTQLSRIVIGCAA